MYEKPSLELLREYTPDQIFTEKERVEDLKTRLQRTIDAFKLGAEVINTQVTSMAITFSLQMKNGARVNSLLQYKADFELALSSVIEMEDSGAGTIDITIKNMNRPLVGLRTILESEEYQKAESPLTIGVGVDMKGNPVCLDLAETPHLLISGTTGSGKTVFIDDILISLLYKASPKAVQLLLIDPKYVELMSYNSLPHLISPVISDANRSLDAFMAVEDRLMSRYEWFAQHGVKNIEGYNEYAILNGKELLPRIVVIVDEYSDLMLTAPKEMNTVIDRIARMGRAAGVHLILATQLPIAKVVTPEIKANIPSRASFAVVDSRESRIILSRTGAQKLLGSGDMLLLPQSEAEAIHAQAAYVSFSEVQDVVRIVKQENSACD